MKTLDNYKRSKIFLFILIVLFVTLAFFSINIGYVPLTFERTLSTIFGRGDEQENLLVWVVRMPRTFVCLIVGICLSIAGAVMQGVTRNALATPSMIGINSGASLAILIIIYLNEKGLGYIMPMPLVATVGGILTFTLVYFLALKFELSPVKLILNGIAINSCLGAINLLLTMKLSEAAYEMRAIVLGGSVTYASWDMIILSILIMTPFIIYIIYKAFHLNILNLGDEIAIGLGISLKKERRKLLYTTVILSSISAYIAGGISFIGMVAPHIAKRLVGANFKLFMPLSIFIGANLVLFADILARILVNNGQFVPIGTLISIVGAPYLIYLLFSDDR